MSSGTPTGAETQRRRRRGRRHQHATTPPNGRPSETQQQQQQEEEAEPATGASNVNATHLVDSFVRHLETAAAAGAVAHPTFTAPAPAGGGEMRAEAAPFEPGAAAAAAGAKVLAAKKQKKRRRRKKKGATTLDEVTGEPTAEEVAGILQGQSLPAKRAAALQRLANPQQRGAAGKKGAAAKNQAASGGGGGGVEGGTAGGRWWRDLTEADPISLEPLSELPYPPLQLHVDAAADDGGTVEAWFDGRVLASYLVSTGRFAHPISRRELEGGECTAIDAYLRRHRLLHGQLRAGAVRAAWECRAQYGVEPVREQCAVRRAEPP
jgi:hypothetical protein